VIALLLVPAYALADRLAGRGRLHPRLPGRGVFWTAAALFLACLPFSAYLAFLALAWGVYRCFDWNLFGADLTPTRAQIAPTFLRHLLPALAFLIIGPWWLLFALAYAVTATALACWCAAEKADGRDRLAISEWVRGGCFGAAAAGWWITSAGWGVHDVGDLLAHWDKLVTLAAGVGFLLSWWRVTRKDRTDLAAFAQAAARDMLDEHRKELDRLRGRLEGVEAELGDLRKEYVKMLADKDAEISMLRGALRQKEAEVTGLLHILDRHHIPRPVQGAEYWETRDGELQPAIHVGGPNLGAGR
jgi:hypothetical protein